MGFLNWLRTEYFLQLIFNEISDSWDLLNLVRLDIFFLWTFFGFFNENLVNLVHLDIFFPMLVWMKISWTYFSIDFIWKFFCAYFVSCFWNLVNLVLVCAFFVRLCIFRSIHFWNKISCAFFVSLLFERKFPVHFSLSGNGLI